MKRLILLAAVFSLPAFAQSVNVDSVGQEGEGTTTIQIKKTKSTETAPATGEKAWEITDGTADVMGETQAMVTDAKTSWKKACNDWKKEFRADNKENKIINLNCGIPNCSGEAAKKTCVSTASYKIKTKTN